MAMGYWPLASGMTGALPSHVQFSRPGANSRSDAKASSQVIFLPDSQAMRPMMQAREVLAQRSVSL